MMQHGIVTLKELLPRCWLDKPAAPEVSRQAILDRPPHPKPPKVLGDPTRTPVNRQAAMLLSKPAEFHQPPFPAEPPRQPEIIVLREENARLKQANTTITNENKALRRRLERLTILVNQKPRATPPPRPPAPAPPAPSAKQQLLERLQNGR